MTQQIKIANSWNHPKLTYASKNGFHQKIDCEQLLYKQSSTQIKYEGCNIQVSVYPITDKAKPEDFIEVQLIEKEFKSDNFITLYDYILERETSLDGSSEKIYILSEPIELSLNQYIEQKGPLRLNNYQCLFKCIIESNYLLQTKVGIPHKNLCPSNIAVLTSEDPITKRTRTSFKIGFVVKTKITLWSMARYNSSNNQSFDSSPKSQQSPGQKETQNNQPKSDPQIETPGEEDDEEEKKDEANNNATNTESLRQQHEIQQIHQKKQQHQFSRLYPSKSESNKQPPPQVPDPSFSLFKAPEVLYIALTRNKNAVKLYKIHYEPPKDQMDCFRELSGDMKKENFRSDAFSAGLILLKAATGKSLKAQQVDNFGNTHYYRNGAYEQKQIIDLVQTLNYIYGDQCVSALLSSMLFFNPLTRCDFEEIVLKCNKLTQSYHSIPKIEMSIQDPGLKSEITSLRNEKLTLQNQLRLAKQDVEEFQVIFTNIKDSTPTLLKSPISAREQSSHNSLVFEGTKSESGNLHKAKHNLSKYSGHNMGSFESGPIGGKKSISSSGGVHLKTFQKSNTASEANNSLLQNQGHKSDKSNGSVGGGRVVINGSNNEKSSEENSNYEEEEVFSANKYRSIHDFSPEDIQELNSMMKEQIQYFEYNDKNVLKVETIKDTDEKQSKDQVEFLTSWFKFSKIPKIEVFELKIWNVFDEVYLKLADQFSYIRTLINFDFRTTGRINDFGLKGLSRAISTLPNLQTLAIQIQCIKLSKITDKGIVHLIGSIIKLQNLQSITLVVNPYSKNNGEVIITPETARQMKNRITSSHKDLKELTVIFNQKQF